MKFVNKLDDIISPHYYKYFDIEENHLKYENFEHFNTKINKDEQKINNETRIKFIYNVIDNKIK